MQELIEAKFSIGNVIKHKFLNFRGVIFDLDPSFNNTEEWYNACLLYTSDAADE